MLTFLFLANPKTEIRHPTSDQGMPGFDSKLKAGVQGVHFDLSPKTSQKNISVKNLSSKLAFSVRMPAFAAVAA